MAYPQTVMPVKAELMTSDAVWHDITTDVFGQERGGVTIDQGRRDESASADAASCLFQVNNLAGQYSPRNPTGTYYGLIGRNTPIRFSSTAKTNYLLLDGSAQSNANAPDSAGLSITGDIEIIVDLEPENWRSFSRLMQKWTTTGNQRSYCMEITTGGYVRFFWSNNGTAELNADSTVPLPFTTGRHAVKVTFDVNNGASGNTATFYYADTATGSFTQLGDPVITAGTTSIFDSTALLYAFTSIDAKYYRLIVKQNIAGTTRADVNFTSQSAGATSFSDGINTWSVAADASLSDRDYRFHGEVSSWPTRWDKSNNDRWVNVRAFGPLRRLIQGDPVESTIYSAMIDLDNAVAYWPMEEGSGADVYGAAIGDQDMVIENRKSVDFASSQVFNGSKPLSVFSNTVETRGNVDRHTSTGESQVRFLLSVPSGGLTNGSEIVSVNYTGSANHWQLRYGTGGTITIRAFDIEGNSMLTDGPYGFTLDGDNVLVSIGLTQNGANIDYEVVTWQVDEGLSGLVASGTVAAATLGRATRVQFNTNQGLGDDWVVGHCVVQTEVTSIFERSDELRAYVGEAAATRIDRLCGEQGVACRVYGDADDSTLLGPQLPATLVELLREAAAADGGILHEGRDFLGLAYVPRTAMYSQPATCSAAYAASGIQVMDPVEDDFGVKNDVRCTMNSGSSFRLSEPDGNNGTEAIGRYPSEDRVSVQARSQLKDEVRWRLLLGTWDEARIPTVEFDFGNRAIYNDATLWADLCELRPGHRLEITDPPAENLPPDDLSLLVQGYTEYFANFERQITFNTSPEKPWRVGVVDDDGAAGWGYSAYDTDGSALNGAHNSSTTSLSVEQTTSAAAAGKPLWTTDAGEMPFNIMVAGELMTVTAISGTTSPQTFTVTRSVNGVSKSHSDGEAVALADGPGVFYGHGGGSSGMGVLAGQRIRAGDITDVTRFVKVKGSSENVTSSTTLQNDDALFLDLDVGTWEVDLYISFSGAAAADIKSSWTTTGTMSLVGRQGFGPSTNTASVAAGDAISQSGAIGTVWGMGIDGSLSSGGHERITIEVTVAGRLQWQWAQNGSSATPTTVSGSSRLIYSKLTEV